MLPVDLRFVTRADPDLRALVPSSSQCSRSFMVDSRGSRGVAVREGMPVDSRFFPNGDDFRGLRVAPDPPPGGDASSDSYCFVSSAASSASFYDSFTGEVEHAATQYAKGCDRSSPRSAGVCRAQEPQIEDYVASTAAVLAVFLAPAVRPSTDRWAQVRCEPKWMLFQTIEGDQRPV